MMRSVTASRITAFAAAGGNWSALRRVSTTLPAEAIFVVTIVMGDFITFDVMGGEQIASAGKVVETRLNALQFPPAAANAVILLAVTLLIIAALNRVVDVQKEL